MITTFETIQTPKTSQLLSWLVFLCAGGTLFLAPLVRGGNRQIALVVLLALGLIVAAALLAHASYQWLAADRVTRPGIPKLSITPIEHENSTITSGGFWWMLVMLIALSPVWVSAVQLIPIGNETWSNLAGRASYLAALASAEVPVPNALPISLVPSATWAALWATVPVSAVFVAALLLGQRDVEKLLLLLFFAAGIQAILGLLQLIQGPKSAFYFESAFSGIIGSFNNRNHLADFLAMLIPPWFYFLMIFLKKKKNSRESKRSNLSSATPLWFFGGFAMLVMILLTRSRGGLIAVTSVLFLTILFYIATQGKNFKLIHKLSVVVVFLLFSIFALMAVDTDTLAQRWEGQQFKTDAEIRNAYALATLNGARTFWPWGSGMGTFEAVFPRFQPLQTPGYVPHAHNDYAQMLMELGAAAPVILTAAAILVGWQILVLWRAAKRRRGTTTEISLRVFSGLGALALLIHSWVEFNMHIPALAITAAFLAGIFLRPLSSHVESRSKATGTPSSVSTA